MLIWPSSLPLYPQANTESGGPVGNRYSFQTDSQIPIERPRTTAEVETYDVTLGSFDRAMAAAFVTWHRGPLAFGVERFVWLHPLFLDFRVCKIASADPAYTVAKASKRSWSVRFSLMILPTDLDQSAYAIRVAGRRRYIEELT